MFQALLASTAAVIVSAAVTVGVVAVQVRQASVERSLALAVAANTAADRGFDARALRLGVLAAREGYLRLAAPEAEPALTRAAKDWRHVLDLLGHDKGVTDLAFSPDGTRVATASRDGTARLWDTVSGRQIGQPLRHEETIFSVAFSPAGARVATASWDRTVQLWETNTGKPTGRDDGRNRRGTLPNKSIQAKLDSAPDARRWAP
jgi:WD40 repeat protein